MRERQALKLPLLLLIGLAVACSVPISAAEIAATAAVQEETVTSETLGEATSGISPRDTQQQAAAASSQTPLATLAPLDQPPS